MVYLVYAENRSIVANRCKTIVSTLLHDVDELNFVKFDFDDVEIDECIDEANNIPLGYDKKIVQIDNCRFLLNGKSKKTIENTKRLIDFIKHPIEECNIILNIDSLDINAKTDIYKAILESGKIIKIDNLDQKNWFQGVSDYCRKKLNMNIDNDALSELADRTSGDISLMSENAKKLSLYKEHITYDDVCALVTRPLDQNAFQIFNYLINEQNLKAIALYRDLKQNNNDVVSLISMLANQVRLLEQIYYLSKKGLSNDEIAKELGIKEIRVTIMKKNIYKMSISSIHRTLENLYLLDLQIKSGLIEDHSYIFEMFLLNFRRL